MALSVGVHALKSDATTNTTTTAAVTTQATGSTFIAAICYPHSDTVTSVTDSFSNTYVLVQQQDDVGDGFKTAIYKCENGAGGAGHTCALKISSTDPKIINFIEIKGGTGAITVDAFTGVNDTSSPFHCSTTTTVKAVEILICVLASSGTTATVTWNGGYTAIDSDSSGVITGFSTAQLVTSSIGTYDPAATTSAGLNASLINVALSDPVPPVPPYGYIPLVMGGRASQPKGTMLFTLPPGSTDIPAVVAPIQGYTISGSVSFGSMVFFVPPTGFIQPPGPGLTSPYNPTQFSLPIGDVNQPSTGNLFGNLTSGSVAFSPVTGTGALSAYTVVGTTLNGLLSGIPAGSIPGTLVSGSVAYGSLVGSAFMSGLTVSGSHFAFLQIGGSFLPLIPMTAVVDVRLNVGYQPWRLGPDGVIR